MILLGLALALAALLLFGLATDRHYQRWQGRRPDPRVARRMRGVAWLLVTTSFVIATAAWGMRIGPVGWLGLVMAGAAATFLFLNLARAPHRRP